jgi:hypothetical protein
MQRFTLDVSAYKFFAAAAGPARPAQQYDGDKAVGQAHDEATGLPLFTAEILMSTDEEAQTVRVKFPAVKAPEFKTLEPIAVTGLRATVIREKVYFAAALVATTDATAKKGVTA